MAIDLMALADGLNAARRQDLAACVARVGLDDGELIADEANRKITSAHAAEQTLADLFAENIADPVPRRVVDRREAIEIEAEDGKARPRRKSQQGFGCDLACGGR